MEKVFAQTGSTPLGPIGQGGGLGPFAGLDYGTAGRPLAAILSGISSIIGVMTILGAIWFVFQVLIGGIVFSGFEEFVQGILVKSPLE